MPILSAARKCLSVLVLASTVVCSSAQQVAPQPPAPANRADWTHVQALPSGILLRVSSKTQRTVECNLKSVDPETLTCVHSVNVTPLTFSRTDVNSIKIPRRGHSTIAAMGIAAGVLGVGGAIALEAVNHNETASGRAALALAAVIVYGIFGGLIGIPIGYFTDFTAKTIYRAN